MAVLTTMQSTVEKPHAAEESDSESSQEGNDDDFDTSVIDEYSVQLQLVYHLLVRNSELSDADMRYYLLGSLHSLCIHCEVLSSGAKKHKKFLRFCQESLVCNYSSLASVDSIQENSYLSSIFFQLTGLLWQLLESTHSHVAQMTVPLLIHFSQLPG